MSPGFYIGSQQFLPIHCIFKVLKFVYLRLSVCLCVITWQNIDHAGVPQTSFSFAWPNGVIIEYKVWIQVED